MDNGKFAQPLNLLHCAKPTHGQLGILCVLACTVQATSELLFCSQPQRLGLCHGNQSVCEEHRHGRLGLNIHGGLGNLLPSPLALRSLANHERNPDWGRPLAWSGQSFFVSTGPQDLNLNSVLRLPSAPLTPAASTHNPVSAIS